MLGVMKEISSGEKGGFIYINTWCEREDIFTYTCNSSLSLFIVASCIHIKYMYMDEMFAHLSLTGFHLSSISKLINMFILGTNCYLSNYKIILNQTKITIVQIG